VIYSSTVEVLFGYGIRFRFEKALQRCSVTSLRFAEGFIEIEITMGLSFVINWMFMS
jgi:hypothetical protein